MEKSRSSPAGSGIGKRVATFSIKEMAKIINIVSQASLHLIEISSSF